MPRRKANGTRRTGGGRPVDREVGPGIGFDAGVSVAEPDVRANVLALVTVHNARP